MLMCLQRNAEQFYRAMSDVKGLKPVMPAGAMYMMVTDICIDNRRRQDRLMTKREKDYM